MPNETAPAHRHVAFAMRFIIEGQGGFTAVHGRRVRMQRGDVILTPTWNYHDHGKDGSGPMIWLDGLDLPQFRHFPVHFVQHYADPRYPVEDIDTSNSPIVFPWAKMQADLDAANADWIALPYERQGGKPGEFMRRVSSSASLLRWITVSRTLGGSAERLSLGASSPSRQETASSVYHIVQGTGYSIIDGTRFNWKTSDTFCVPSWNTYQHFAGGGEPCYFYRFDDKPMIESLGFYREAGVDTERYVS
jgi:gentisate 1,2-dioxygenase